MRITVRKCPFTGKIFEEKDVLKYIDHLKRVREKQQKYHRYSCIRKEFSKWLAEERASIREIGEISPWFIKHQQYIMDATNANVFENKSPFDKFVDGDIFTNIDISAKYCSSVSNTHVCPDSGVTNWGYRDKTLPNGYCGFEGMITGCLIRPPDAMGYPYGEALNLVGLKTGSGGGGRNRWNYGVSIFLADWPGIGEEITIARLKGIR